MGEDKSKPRHRFPTWGIILVLLGVVFLLQSLDVLPWGLWGTIWRLWPVILIAIGLNIILSRINFWLAGGVVLTVLVASLGIAIWYYGPGDRVGTSSFSEPLGDLQSAEVEINFGAGKLIISSLPEDSSNFVEARADDGGLTKELNRSAGRGTLKLSMERKWWRWGDVSVTWEVKLSRTLPLELIVKSGASDMELNLTDLKMGEFRLDTGASRANVVMPAKAGLTRASITAGAANVTITIPEGVAARVKTDTGLASIDVDEGRFPRSGDYYLSPNFDTAENRLDLSVKGGVASISIR